MNLPKKNFQRVLKGEDGIPYELRFKDTNGQVRIVEVHSRPVLDGRKIIGICGISREITKRKLAEELLHQSEARYRAVVEDQAELICRYLPDCTLTFVNNAYCHYFGKARDELLGQKFQALITGQERKMVGQKLAALTPERPTTMHEQTALAAGGEIRWQQWVTRGLFDEKGAIKELQAVGRDITIQKIAEDALKASAISLEKLVKERTAELENKSKMLEELNIALKVLLRQSGDRKDRDGRSVYIKRKGPYSLRRRNKKRGSRYAPEVLFKHDRIESKRNHIPFCAKNAALQLYPERTYGGIPY